MTDFEQTFFEAECKICSLERNRVYYGMVSVPRTFVTCADDSNKAVCTNCGYFMILNKREVK